MAQKEQRTLEMEINGRKVGFPEGVTVLRAAELNGFAIPSLCSHKDLSPFGGCRLCMVEIEGLRGYPLSCTTAAEEGMKVMTDTNILQDLRKEMLKLILSEHPSSCLICDERGACKDYQGTIRKAGVTTGCRFCPNDDHCELQDAIDQIGLTEIDYPILYHGYEPEQDDPFFDRDYNICILCGRCVRMCQEVRGTSVLAFTQRGPRTKIGTAYGRSHLEAGCEFCGACVDVCPTGALADKASKWEGKPDGHHVSTCPFCAIGCQVELNHKGGRFTKAKAHIDPEVNDGQLCVRGRFCMPEVTHHYDRAKKPMLQKGKFFREVSWEEAMGKVAGELKDVSPDEFLMLVSPDLTTESLFAAQKFVRECLKSTNIDSSARLELSGGLDLWSWLFSQSISLKEITIADVVIACGLDSRFDFSIVGTKIRQSINRGTKLITIDPRDSNLAGYTDDWLRPSPGKEGLVLQAIANSLTGKKTDYEAVAEEASLDPAALKKALEMILPNEDITVIVGAQVFHYSDNGALVDSLMTLTKRKNTSLIPLYFGANARGALEMGVFPEIDPGGVFRKKTGWGLDDLSGGEKRPKVLYCVGDIPFLERPDCDFLIVQDTYLPSFQVDAFLPAASFAEAGGTLVNLEGRIQEVVQVENLPEGALTGFSRPDWKILSELANALNCLTMNYKTDKDVRSAIRKAVPDFPPGISRRPRRMDRGKDYAPPKPKGEKKEKGAFWLVAEPGGYRHRAIDIASKVAGLRELALEEGFRMNPGDLDTIGAKSGDRLTLSLAGAKTKVTDAVKSDMECPQGVIAYSRPVVFGGLDDRRHHLSLYKLAANPIRVNISKSES